MTADYWLWCHCAKPDNEGSPFGMCRTCKRKPHGRVPRLSPEGGAVIAPGMAWPGEAGPVRVGHVEAWPGHNVHRPEVKSPGGGNDLTASGHQETT